MFNTILFGTPQTSIFVYTYYPISNYADPFFCTSPTFTTPFLQNSGPHISKSQMAAISSPKPTISVEMNRQDSTIYNNSQVSSKRRNYRTKSKLIQSAKKNCQSNIINHVLSFLVRHRQSQKVLQKAIKNLQKPQNCIEQIKQLFYNFLRLINLKRERKYINRRTLFSLFQPSGLLKELPLIEVNLQQSNLIQIDELCYLYRNSKPTRHSYLKEDRNRSQEDTPQKKNLYYPENFGRVTNNSNIK